jgi:hypothetical protein
MPSRKGSPNRNKQFLLNRLKDIYGDDFDPIIKMAEQAAEIHKAAVESKDIEDRKDAVVAWEKIAKYTTPALKAIEVDVTSGGNDLPTIIELVAKK